MTASYDLRATVPLAAQVRSRQLRVAQTQRSLNCEARPAILEKTRPLVVSVIRREKTVNGLAADAGRPAAAPPAGSARATSATKPASYGQQMAATLPEVSIPASRTTFKPKGT